MIQKISIFQNVYTSLHPLFHVPQVWIIADKVQGSLSLSCGTVCHRLGVQPVEPKGQSWDYGIGVRRQSSIGLNPTGCWFGRRWTFNLSVFVSCRADGTTSQ